MDWLRRTGSGRGSAAKTANDSPHRPSIMTSHVSRSRKEPSPGSAAPTLTSTPRGDKLAPQSANNGGHGDQALDPPASPIARRQLRMDTDPETCSEVFRSHWSQALAVLSKSDASPSISIKRSPQEDIEAVIRYVDQMMLLLIEEEAQDGGQGPILEFLLTEDILERLLTWSNTEQIDQLRLHQLKMYDVVISQARQDVLIHKPVIRPLLKLLGTCRENTNADIEYFVVLILHQLCVCVTQNKHILELLFDASADHGPAKFLVFSLLITYIHREGDIGQQARDALLLIMSLSSVHDDIGQYISNNSDFCPVLATGLSGLYSSLPRKMDYPSDDWYRLRSDDVVIMPELVMFLNSLDFCNAVVQVANRRVGDQLLVYIYNGFLVPVLGPALHQTSMEEVIAATAYLDLFLRRITEPALIRTFLKFILTAAHDDVNILESLITRISSNSRLCMVTLSLFRTLIELNCEDVMFQLVFKYLIPCTHVMVSQRRAVKDVDLYCKTAEKLLSLRPACCIPDPADSVADTSAVSDTTSVGSRSSSPERGDSGSLVCQSPGGGTAATPLETTYLEYLKAVRVQIEECNGACQCWSLPYDGDYPPIDSLDGGVIQPSLLDSPKSMASKEGSPAVTSPLANGVTEDPIVTAVGSLGGSDSADVKDDSNSVTQTVFESNIPSSGCVDSVQNGGDDFPKQTTQRLSYTESVTSDVDSAFSGSSAHTDAPLTSVSHSPSRGDSPLSDHFANANFSAFLLSLKRVKTPVEYCDSIEDSFNEIDSIANELRQSSSRAPSVSKTSADILTPGVSSGTTSPTLQSCNDNECVGAEFANRPTVVLSGDENNVTATTCMEDQTSTTSIVMRRETVTNVCDATPQHEHEGNWSVSPLLTPLKQTGHPNIGPFLATLLGRLEMMMQNTLYVNLLLTGVLMRLACYPQPLLHSFLLNHTLVFQPTVKSLIQVLGSVKQKVDCFAMTVKNFEEMLAKARLFLLWREETYLHSIGETSGRRDSTASFPGALGHQRGGPNAEPHKEKRSAFRDLFRRGQTPVRSRPNEPRLRLLSDKQGFRYINQKSPPGGTPEAEPVVDQLEALKTKNAVYCALVLDEFLKELAAISQEHAVSCL